MLKTIVAAAALFAAACIDDGVDGMPGNIRTVKSADNTPDPTKAMTGTAERPVQTPPDETPQCSMLPQDDSACAHACDPDALIAFVPAGTCAMFSCPLSDGTTILTGACNH